MLNESPARTSSHTVFVLATVALVAIGAALRFRQYFTDTSFFSDEAALVLNLRTHSAGQLLRELDHGQAAPPVFLWVSRAAYLRFGPSEEALRFLPMAGGVVALVLFAFVAWSVFPAPVAVVAVGLFTFCDKLILFCADLKQYSTDALVAVVLFWVAFAWNWEGEGASEPDRFRRMRLGGSLALPGAETDAARREPRPPLQERRHPGSDRMRSALARLAALSGVAACAVWLSHTTTILYGAFGLVLLFQCARESRKSFALGLLCGVFAGASFVTLYLVSIRHLQSQYLYDYWRSDFPDWSHPVRFPMWLIQHTYALIDEPYRYLGWVALPLMVCGAIFLGRSGRSDLLAALTLPIALTALAACLHQYPYNGSRLTLFLFPGLFVLMGFGMLALREWLPARTRVWAIPGIVIVCIGAAMSTGAALHPHYRSHIRPVVSYVKEHLQPGDVLYLLGEPGPPEDPLDSPGRHLELLAYWPDPPAEVHTTIRSLDEIHARRFWVVLAYRPQIKRPLSLFEAFKPIANPVGDPFVTAHGGAACLFTLKQ